MRRLILWSGVSLDGFIEGPDRDISWHRVDEELHQHMNDHLRERGAFLSGRVTWQLMADFWPTADEDPEAPAQIRDFATIWRDTPKIVYSTTLQEAGWNTTIVRDVVAEEVNALKQQDGGDLVLNGANVSASFIEQDLVDDYRIYVHPVIVGAGTPLFGSARPFVDLRLVESHVFGNGVVLLHYQVNR